MALIIETGDITPGASSYASVEEFRLYATARGFDLPVDNALVETMLVKAMDYLESFAAQFKGVRVDRDQALSWPRYDVVIEDWPWLSTEIPRQVISAQLALGAEIANGEDPLNPTTELPVISERVEGAVEVQYAKPANINKVTKYAPSATIIKLLLKNSGLFLIRA